MWLTRNADREEMRLHHLISVLSVLRNFRPAELRFHYDVMPRGRYWHMALGNISRHHATTRFVLERLVAPPSEIFGTPILIPEHVSDIIRLDLIRRYGGVYLDLDVIVTGNLTSLMCHEFVLGEEEEGCCTPNAFMMAAPNSTFARLWWDSYRLGPGGRGGYRNRKWGWNSVLVPWRLAERHPDLVHVERRRMMRPNYKRAELRYIYEEGLLYDWRGTTYYICGTGCTESGTTSRPSPATTPPWDKCSASSTTAPRTSYFDGYMCI